MNMIQDIINLIHTLNLVDVRGEENHDMISGCIKTLKQMKLDLEAEPAKEQEKGA